MIDTTKTREGAAPPRGRGEGDAGVGGCVVAGRQIQPDVSGIHQQNRRRRRAIAVNDKSKTPPLGGGPGTSTTESGEVTSHTYTHARARAGTRTRARPHTQMRAYIFHCGKFVPLELSLHCLSIVILVSRFFNLFSFQPRF